MQGTIKDERKGEPEAQSECEGKDEACQRCSRGSEAGAEAATLARRHGHGRIAAATGYDGRGWKKG